MNILLRSNSFKLSLMMFFQYMMFAVWWVPLAAYLTNIGIDGSINTSFRQRQKNFGD